ncbi:glycosyltransferase [Parvularcula oceani]|uniref:glycosyltransferase n=1 Tax=Parvularcula oceani TaxID=1247963 RepID=UPI0004E1D179|nr:glycosyltransferase [Parvularcula oceani]
MQPLLTAHRRLSETQKRVCAALAVTLLMAGALAPLSSLVALNALFLTFTLAALALRFAAACLSHTRGREPVRAAGLAEEALPVVTVLCPAYREAASLPGLIGALESLDYPSQRLDVKLLLEADDAETQALARTLAPRFPLEVVIVPPGMPQTKPRACNHGLWRARGELLVIYDAEDRPEANQLRRAAAAFAALPHDVVCLQARLNYYNRSESWVTRLFAIEYALLFDLILPGLDRLGAPLPLGGTSNIFRGLR